MDLFLYKNPGGCTLIYSGISIRQLVRDALLRVILLRVTLLSVVLLRIVLLRIAQLCTALLCSQLLSSWIAFLYHVLHFLSSYAERDMKSREGM